MKELRSSYNRVIYLTCFALILIASAIEGGQYIRQRESQISDLQAAVDGYARSIDNRAKSIQGYVEGLRGTAKQYLFYVKNYGMTSPLWRFLKQLPNQDMYSLDIKEIDKHLVGNLTGLGQLDKKNQHTVAELQMVLLLNLGFQVAFQNTPGAIWIYYTSRKEFQNLYPWLPSSPPSYYRNVSRIIRMDQAGPEQNPERLNVWSAPYEDRGGDGDRYKWGKIISNISPVYSGNQFLGNINLDISLNEFDQLISKFHIPTGSLILLTQDGDVLSHTSVEEGESLQNILSSEVGQQIMTQLKERPRNTLEVGDHFVYMRNLPSAPWVLVYVGKTRLMFEENLIHGLEDILIIAFCLIFVVGIGYFVVTRDFISPAQRLLTHIEKENRGEPSHPADLPQRWAEWFAIVSKIFKENRSLMDDLESRVKRRTQQLQTKNRKLETTLEDLKKAQDQIILQEKLASLGSLTAGIAHEIKNPLHFIINFTDVSIESLADLKKGLSPKEAKHVEDIAQNMARVLEHANRADSIVKGMLSHARGSDGKFEYSDVNKLITDAANLAYAGFCGKENMFPLDIQTKLDKNIPPIKVSSQDLSRVFLNITNNACFAMYEKLQKKKKGYDPTLKIRTQKDKDAILITIEDNGIGMPKSVMKKIFHPFFTTKEAGKGTGLGMSLSYEILTQQHQGEVWIESELNKYSRFIIKLPC